MNLLRFFCASIFITFLLLASVVITDIAASVFTDNTSANEAIAYPVKDMLLGLVSESLRAVFICYLFTMLGAAGKSYWYAIKFGLLVSALIATMWLVIGYGSFVLKNPTGFVVYDGIILVLQGIVSGAGVQFLYKRKMLIPQRSS